MSNSLNDGLNKPDQLASDAITYDEMAYGQIGAGSPTAVGNIVQTGQGTSSAGSVLNVTFGTAFLGTPTVIPNQQDGAATSVLVAGSISTTGFTYITGGASKIVDWIANGSGTI